MVWSRYWKRLCIYYIIFVYSLLRSSWILAVFDFIQQRQFFETFEVEWFNYIIERLKYIIIIIIIIASHNDKVHGNII